MQIAIFILGLFLAVSVPLTMTVLTVVAVAKFALVMWQDFCNSVDVSDD